MKHYAIRALRILVAFLVVGTALLPAQMHAATNMPPTFTSTPPTTPVIAGQIFSYVPLATDADGDAIYYSLSRSFDGMSMALDHTITWSPKLSGTYAAEVRAQDSFGNITSQPLTISVVHGNAVTIQNTPVAASLIAGQSVAIHVTAFDQFKNQWDVSSLATLAVLPDAGGSLSSLTYVSEKAGVWSLTSQFGSLFASTALTVAQGSISGITTTPTLTTATTDQRVSISTQARDAQGNSWDVTGFTNTTTSDSKGSIEKNVYHPHTAGTQKVSTTLNAFIASNDISVQPGTPAFMNVDPKGPMSLALQSTQAFSVSVTDKFGNAIANPQCTWSLSKNLGTLSQAGTFHATTAGTGFIQVAYANLTTSVPVSVGVATASTIAFKTNAPQVKGETIAQNQTTTANASNESKTADKKTSTTSCSSPALWIVILILFAYEVILCTYFLLTKNDQDSTWWIFPVLLTIIGIIIWNKYFCSGYVWWPWTLVGMSAVTTFLLERKKENSPPSANQSKQPPMF